MAIVFRCKRCQEVYSVPEANANRRGNCAKCGETNIIPSASDPVLMHHLARTPLENTSATATPTLAPASHTAPPPLPPNFAAIKENLVQSPANRQPRDIPSNQRSRLWIYLAAATLAFAAGVVSTFAIINRGESALAPKDTQGSAAVVQALKMGLHDPASLEIQSIDGPRRFSWIEQVYQVKYRSKNAYGAKQFSIDYFELNGNSAVAITPYYKRILDSEWDWHSTAESNFGGGLDEYSQRLANQAGMGSPSSEPRSREPSNASRTPEFDPAVIDEIRRRLEAKLEAAERESD